MTTPGRAEAIGLAQAGATVVVNDIAPALDRSDVLDEIADAHGDKITFLKMNVDENPVTPASYRVTGIPTINVYQNGEVVKSIVGARPKAMLLKELESFI